MKTDFISRKERIKFNDKLFQEEFDNPVDKLSSAINSLQCAKQNKDNAKTGAYRDQVLWAIELLKKELH